MRSIWRVLAFAVLLLLVSGNRVMGQMASVAAAGPNAGRRQLRVCADPNNLPFSNEHGDGFENKLAVLLAHDMNADIVYTWRPQRRGFLRETLNAKKCDIVMGVPAKLENVTTTRPYYRSGYVFVFAPNVPQVASLDAPALHSMRIGVPLVGDDGANPPPLLALAAHGLLGNMRGYSVYGDYAKDSPPADVIRALRAGDIDVAIAWGPLAGYYAKHAGRPALALVLIPETEAPAGLTFTFDIAMGVRRDDAALAAEVDAFLIRRRRDIDRVLASYSVPTL